MDARMRQYLEEFHANPKAVVECVAEYKRRKGAAAALVAATSWADIEARFRREAAQYVEEAIADKGDAPGTRIDLIRLAAMRQRLGVVR